MPDSQSNVEINLRINATNREAVNQLQNDLNRLKGTVTESTGQYTGFTGAVTGAERATNIFGGQARTASAATVGLTTATTAAKNEAVLLQSAIIGVAGATALAVTGIVAVGVAMAGLISKGIDLQKQLQDVKSGVEGALTSNSNFSASDSRLGGTAAIKAIQDAADQAQVPVSNLAKAFGDVFPAAVRANTPIKTLADLLANLTVQEGSLHVSQTKMVTDLEAILNGTVSNSNVLAQNLGITKEQAAAWRESGNVAEEVANKVQTFAAVHTESGDTIDRANQKVIHALEDLALKAAEPFIEPVTKALNMLAEALNDPAIQAGAQYIGEQFAFIMGKGLELIAVCQNIGKAIVNALAAGRDLINSGVISLMNPTEGNAAIVDRLSGQEALAAESRKHAGDIELPGIEVRAPGLSAPVGGGGGGGGGGGAKGPSQDVLNQQAISAIQAEINEREAQYHTLIEQNNAAHLLGFATLGKQQSSALGLGKTFSSTLDEERTKLVALQQSVLALGESQGGLNDKEKKQVDNLQQAVDKLDLMKAKLAVTNAQNTFGGSLTIGLRKFSDDLVLTGEKASQVFGQIVNTGIDSTAQALTGLITGTQNWAQAFIQAGEQIIEILIKVALQAVIGAALQQTVNKGTRFEDARTAAAGAYSSAAQIPYIGWILAPIAGAAAFAAVLAFAQGGIVPGPPSDRDNHLARVASGEGIVTAKAVQYYGPETIHAMNAMTFAQGGVVGQFGTPNNAVRTARNISVNNFWDKDEMVQHMITHPDLNHHIVDTIRKNRFLVKV